MAVESKIGLRRAVATQYERTFRRGSLMFIEGENSTDMYIIRSGKVRILKQEGESTIELAVLGPGSVLGELSLLDHQPRGATAQVIEDIVATVIDEALFERTMSKATPWLANIVKVVVKRLRDTMKRTSDDVIRKNVAGVVRIILLLADTAPSAVGGQRIVPLSRAKEMIYAVIGLGGLEAENVFLHLILKGMMLIQKNETGQEHILIKDYLVMQTYMNYLRAKQRGLSVPGEDLSDGAGDLLGIITAAGEKGGKPAGKGAMRLGVAQLELEHERLGKGRHIVPELLDELHNVKIIIPADEGPGPRRGWNAFLYNAENIKRMQLFRSWLPTFREEVQL